MSNSLPGRRPPFRVPRDARDVATLMREARDDRRIGLSSPSPADVELEVALCGPLPRAVDGAAYFARIAGLLQLRYGIGFLRIRIPCVTLPARRARALAVMITDTVSYIAASSPDADEVGVFVALERKSDRSELTLAIGAKGAIGGPVAPLSATRGLLRAAQMAQGLGGRMQRGIEGGRMIFAIGVPMRGARIPVGDAGR